MTDQLKLIDASVIAAYLVGMILVAVVLKKRQTTLEEYFRAGRSVGSTLIGLSILGSSISTISYLSFPGEIIANGPGLLLMNLVFPFSYLVVAYVILPVYFKHNTRSVYEYLERRFDARVRMLGTIMFFLMRISWMAVIIYTASIALASILDLPIFAVIFLLGMVATVYTGIGGIRADIISDAVQTVILFLGALLTIIIVPLKMKGLTPIISAIAQQGKFDVPLLSWELTSVIGVLTWTFFLNIASFGTSQVLVQRYFCAPTIKQARKGILFNFVGSFLFGIILALIGFSLLAFFSSGGGAAQELLPGGTAANPDKLYPLFITRFIPPGLSGLVMAALLAAAMSSLDSGINSSVNVLQVDLREKYNILWPRYPAITFVRRASFAVGLLVTALAFLLPLMKGNLLQVSSKIVGLFEGPMAAVFLLGILSKRATPASVIAGAAAGAVSCALLSYIDLFLSIEPVSFTWIIPTGALVTMAVGYAAGRSKPASA
jgi:SSS family solute:Na+ symporter